MDRRAGLGVEGEGRAGSRWSAGRAAGDRERWRRRSTTVKVLGLGHRIAGGVGRPDAESVVAVADPTRAGGCGAGAGPEARRAGVDRALQRGAGLGIEGERRALVVGVPVGPPVIESVGRTVSTEKRAGGGREVAELVGGPDAEHVVALGEVGGRRLVARGTGAGTEARRARVERAGVGRVLVVRHERECGPNLVRRPGRTGVDRRVEVDSRSPQLAATGPVVGGEMEPTLNVDEVMRRTGPGRVDVRDLAGAGHGAVAASRARCRCRRRRTVCPGRWRSLRPG